MFPEDIDEELNEITVEEEKSTYAHGNDLKLDLSTGELEITDGKIQTVSSKEALLQWIAKIIMTEQNAYDIYSDYGVTMKETMFSDNPDLFKRAEIQENMREKLMEHEEINDVGDFEFIKSGTIEKAVFEIESTYGTIKQEVSFSGTI